MMLLVKLFLYPKVLGNLGILLPLLLQAALLHPHYRRGEKSILLRRVLGPIVVLLTFATAPVRKWQPLPECQLVNFCFVSLVTFHAVCLGIHNAFYDGPILKEKEKKALEKDPSRNGLKTNQPTEDYNSSYGSTRKETNEPGGHPSSNSLKGSLSSKDLLPAKVEDKGQEHVETNPSIGELFRFAVWLVFSPRGLETYWSPSPSVLQLRDSTSDLNFFKEQLVIVTLFHVYGSLCWHILTASLSNPKGFNGVLREHIWVPESALVEFITDYGNTYLLGAIIWSALEISACGVNAFELLFYPLARLVLPNNWAPEKAFNPRLYPRLFSKPWKRTSMSDFWGRGWHALFRRDFMYCGALPAARVVARLGGGREAQKAAGLMGAMLLTAVMHEYAIASISDEKWGIAIISFFMSCALVMLLENTLQAKTRLSFQGAWGRLWTYGWLMFLGKPALDLWIQRGLGQHLIPLSKWKWSQVLLPAGFALPSRWFDRLPF